MFSRNLSITGIRPPINDPVISEIESADDLPQRSQKQSIPSNPQQEHVLYARPAHLQEALAQQYNSSWRMTRAARIQAAQRPEARRQDHQQSLRLPVQRPQNIQVRHLNPYRLTTPPIQAHQPQRVLTPQHAGVVPSRFGSINSGANQNVIVRGEMTSMSIPLQTLQSLQPGKQMQS